MNETKFSKTIKPEELEVFHYCRRDYNLWATCGGNTWEHSPELSAVQAMQIELMRWERHCFGLQPAWTGMAGIFEEFGELEEARNSDDIIDAVGDVLVFSSNMLVKYRIGVMPMFMALKNMVIRGLDRSGYISDAGWLSHCTLKAEQGIRNYSDPETARRDVCVATMRIMRHLQPHAAAFGADLSKIYLKVGSEVLDRDWKARPHDADKVTNGEP